MFREFHWQNTYHSFASELHSCMDCLTVSCLTEHCWVLIFFLSFLSLFSFRNSMNDTQFFLCSRSIIHITLPIYPRTPPLFPYSLKILPLFWIVGLFTFIQLLIYERTFSEFVQESHLPYNIQCAIEFQWKWIFRGLYSVFCIYVFLNISYIQPLKKCEGNKP